MSRGGAGSGPGWGWWPPSRRRQQQQQLAASWRRRQQQRGGSGDGDPRAWPVPAAAYVGLAVAASLSLSLLAAALGISAAVVLSLAAAAGGGAVAASWALTAAANGRGRGGHYAKVPPPPPYKPQRASAYSALANGGPATLGCASPGLSQAERKRLWGRDHLTPPAHFSLSPRRRYPIQQTQYASLGTLPTICWDGYGRKSRLAAHNSIMVQSPVTVKIARPDSNIVHSPVLEHLASPVAFSPTPSRTLDPCARETVLNALKESRKRAVEEEDNRFLSGQESKRRRHDSGGSAQSAFEPLVANGAPASLVPKPGSLKRGLLSHSVDDCSSKRSRTSSLSSMNSLYVGGIPSSIRNAIASSYSSTRGLSQLWKRTGPSTSPLSSPASSRSQTPERPNKKARFPDTNFTEELGLRQCISTPTKADKEAQAETASETPVQNTPRSPGSWPSSGSDGKRKRKIQLLSAQRGHRFALPPPPQLGYSVTSEDLDAEKKAGLQWFNKVLEEKADTVPTSAPLEASSVSSNPAFTLMSARPTTVAPTVGANPLLESLKKMQDKPSNPGQIGTSPEAPLLPAPAESLDLSFPSVSVTSAETKSALPLGIPASLAAVTPSPPPPLSSGSAQPASITSRVVTESSELGQTPTRSPSGPKPSILFGMLTSPSTSQPPVTTAAASPSPGTTPLFKPIFGSLPKSESLDCTASSTSVTTTAPSGTGPSSVPPLVATSNSSTFKPIFGNVPPSTTAAASSLFTFKQPPPPGLPVNTSASTSGGSALSETTVNAAASFSPMASVTMVSPSKPTFSFGLGGSASITASAATATTTTTTTASLSSQPFLFGAPPSAAPATSITPAAAPLFQFGKVASTTRPALDALASSTFSQASSGTAESTATTTTTGFGIFSSSSSTTTQAPNAAPATTTQPSLPFVSCTPAFSEAFGASSKPPPPPYVGDASQLTFDTSGPDDQQRAPKPIASPVSFGTPFSFTSSVTQPAFGSTTQAPFGGTGPLASFGPQSTTQPTFGATTSVFSFGTAATTTASGIGANTQTTNSITGGSTTSPFTFRASSQTSTTGSTFGIGAPVATGTGLPAMTFTFGGGQSGAAGVVTPFSSSLAQNSLGAQSQTAPFAFNTPGTPESKLAFGGASTPVFGQISPAPGGSAGGSNLSFGTPINPAFGGAGPAFGPPTPAFSIGAGSKTGARQRLQARRQHTRKKEHRAA